MTDIEDVLKSIHPSSTTPLQKTLMEIILKSKNAPALPPRLAKSILNLYHDDALSTPEGFKTLLEASITLEREKTAEKLQEHNLDEAAARVKGE